MIGYMITMRRKSIFQNVFIRDIILNIIAASVLTPKRVRVAIYRMAGMELETDGIAPGTFMGGTDIIVGSDTFININCFFDNVASIKIGRGCIIAMEVMFITSYHDIPLKPSKVKKGGSEGKNIVVKNNCWIGARATILPGVTIGEGCVVAAGAVVNKDCEPYGLYAGIPAKRIKDLN
jgi:maltose O-acetyltransferase